ncbi:tRNA dihydrouridine(20/20a) synthase DusA [Enhygromyxa salina]|uniref:tRNA-dihydrouridine(20/20a) synthase n=1 Tax=Enhygromyxa salina TaxID=215803 RepID=A0A2S9XC34_9BACT|nr:tRNA dihydrouridine(20/20a) synthase DusA [Enhygromyxa salina]PRP90417.1 putative tRNA-dihydrouridine synthase [Enhygromyxa salina]
MPIQDQLRPSSESSKSARGVIRPLSVAPMMDRTDRHFRRLLRLISRHTLLYTEMITCPAILNGDRDHLLGYDRDADPLALQLGGDDPEALARCAVIAVERGYDEINLNVGCPSDRVQSGNFGACLMREPERVAACVLAMRACVTVPVTVKHRIGVDELDRYEDMARFVEIVAAAGCDRFTVHARKAWLHGVSPKHNRTVPPLRYAEVHQLARAFPQLVIEINGGIRTLAQILEQLEHVDAVMIGRAAWDDPWMFAAADRAVFGESSAADSAPTRAGVVAAYLDHVEQWLARGHQHAGSGKRQRGGPSPTILLRPLMNLFAGRPGARRWKQALNRKCQAPVELRELHTLALELASLDVL